MVRAYGVPAACLLCLTGRAPPHDAALPFLERTELFLYPIAGIMLLTPFAILSGFNPSRAVLSVYFGKHSS